MKTVFVKKMMVVLLLMAGFAGAFHHHEDTGIHHDCPVYILKSAITSPDIPHESLLSEIEYADYIRITPSITYTENFIHYGNYGRAPPEFS